MRRVLERADAEMARRDAREHRAGQHRLAHDVLAGRHDRERPGRGDAERVHRLADHVLAQHRPDGGLAVAAARERRATRALQVQVATAAVGVEHLAEQQRPAVAEPGRVPTELMAGVGLRDRRRAVGPTLPTRTATPHGPQRLGIDPSSAASSSLSTSSRGAGAGAACHGSYRPSSSRTKELSNANSGRAATLTSSRLAVKQALPRCGTAADAPAELRVSSRERAGAP